MMDFELAPYPQVINFQKEILLPLLLERVGVRLRKNLAPILMTNFLPPSPLGEGPGVRL